MDENLLINSVEKFITEKEDYFKKWIFEEPIVISNTHHKKLVKLHEVMYKLITHFVKNFEDFKDQMILSHKTKQIVKRLENIEYKIGTFRTDFVYDDFQQPKLIEITCRFALNSLFVSSIFDSLSTKYYLNNLKDISIINLYKKNLLYISELSRTGDIFILKGKDNKNESVFFKDIFLRTGTKVYEVDINQISQYMNKMNQNSWIVSELTLDEIESLDINLILELSKLNIINDFRTSLLIHDKQFFSVLGNKKLQQECLSNDEIEFFSKYYIPTYHYNEAKTYWLDAKINKDNWILKHKALGKSKSIYAGIVTTEQDWDEIFKKENLNDFVLQRWVPQNKIKGKILDQEYEDYVTGTLLFFNNNYFGLGPFRTSSFPVTNIVDDRKATSIILAHDLENGKDLFSNYIDS